MVIPHTRPGVWPAEIGVSRFAARIVREAAPEVGLGLRVALLGLPDDTGVGLNHGRPGAAEGPTAFRAAIAKYGVAEPFGWSWPMVIDAGDVVPAAGRDEAAMHETHRRVTHAARSLVEAGCFPIAIGGGHDLTFAFVRGVAEGLRVANPGMPLAGVYFDAHLDVRETVGSGMPFRRLMEECGVGPLLCIGASPLANAREHVEYFRSRGGVIAETLGGSPPGPCFVSLDMDAVDQAYAPGVSAMNPAGFAPREMQAWLTGLGANPNVVCFDIMELSPPHDERGRTARLAAHFFLSFLMGLSQRAARHG